MMMMILSTHAANKNFSESFHNRPYHPSPPADLSNYILCPYGVVVGKIW